MKIIVSQIGARHHYAIPRMLERAGYLDRLYTDSCANHGLGLWCKKYLPVGFQKKWLKGLIQREIKGIPGEKIYTTDELLVELVRQKFFPKDLFNYQLQVGKRFSKGLMRWGTGNADWVYSMFGEGYEFLEFAKERGLHIAIDMFANPITHRIYRAERERYPDWEMQYPINFDHQVEVHINRIIKLSDLMVCPSEAVVDGLRIYPNFCPEKIRLVPYGSGISVQDRASQPSVGRILFGGSANLGKGIQYYALAAELLVNRGVNYEYRVAGSVTDTIRSRPECRHLKFLGHLPRQQMIDEFQQADVFVLPTLAEGSASVINEALAYGVPVITTRSAGSVIEHGLDGLIVPERDGQALSEAIYPVVEDRKLRERLAQAARKSVNKYSEDAWRERLVKIFESIES